MSTTLDDVSIDRLVQYKAPSSYCSFRNDVVVIDDIREIRFFKEPARINAFCLFVCIEGEAECRINLSTFRLHSNCILLNLPGDILQVTGGHDVKGYAILISTEYQRQLQIDFKVRSQAHISIRGNSVVELPEDEIRMLDPYRVLLCKNINDGNADIIRGLSEALSYTVLLNIIRQSANAEYIPEPRTRAQQIFNRFMELLTDHHSSERSLAFYAEKLCLTPKYVSAMVKSYTGKGALDWINDYVVLEAKMLLSNTDMSVQQIAYRLNFPTQSAFGKYFRQQAGMSPKHYRQQLADGKQNATPTY